MACKDVRFEETAWKWVSYEKKAMLALVIILLLPFLSACADVWVKKETARQDFNVDSYQCQNEAGPRGED